MVLVVEQANELDDVSTETAGVQPSILHFRIDNVAGVDRVGYHYDGKQDGEDEYEPAEYMAKQS
jgi:hypothetical protein